MKDGAVSPETAQSVSALIEGGLAVLSISNAGEATAKLTQLVVLVSEWAGRISLTGHRDPLELAGRLVLDAVALSEAIPELDQASSLADLGSGIGFPGFPIAILHPELDVHLVESRLRRHHLQREIRRQLELTRVNPILGRSDGIEARVSDVVVAQAMTNPDEALKLMRSWARPGGLVALPAADSAERLELSQGYCDLELREYRVPASGRIRRLWIARVEGP
ncbi:MAG: RsmG family class I SAM-dependent methyltransferase [Myxococcales bacterium]